MTTSGSTFQLATFTPSITQGQIGAFKLRQSLTSMAAKSATPEAKGWRVILHQRHDLYARPAERLRPMGPTREPGWSWDDVLPLFKSMERYQHGADEFHGGDGELRVEERRVSWDILDAWQKAAAECGIPTIDEFNRGDNFGCAYFQMNQRKGVRWSASKAFLRPVTHRPNLTVITHAEVHRLEGKAGTEGFCIEGVWVGEKGGAPRLISARREVILAAGSVASPQILQHSGIGPGDHLSSYDIPCHVDSQGGAWSSGSSADPNHL